MPDPEWEHRRCRARRHLVDGLARVDLPSDALWVDYLTLGGALSAAELTAAVAGGHELTRRDHDLLAHAINERLAPGARRVPYTDQLG